ncbi:MAG: hypothetical protein ACREJ0_16440, partial [Geminicoccaceae bacterium]
MTLSDLMRRLEDLMGVSAAKERPEGVRPPRLRSDALWHGVKLGLRAAISIGLLVWVISGIDLGAAGAVMLRANLLLVPVILALMIAERLLASLRWY